MSPSLDDPATRATITRLLAAGTPGADVALDPFLHGVTAAILSARAAADQTALHHRHAKGGAVSAARAVPVGLIVGELVSNAIAYAHPAGVRGRIDVTSHAGMATGSLVIEVQDDGVGLPERFDPRIDGGTGLTGVRALADQLGAKLYFSDTGIGLSVRLDVPAPAPCHKARA